ncbi:pilus assembly PilX family protein [Allochromatium vinosum]|uniref:Type 4 fimbrial biogenesis protein PilX N-terminal domain-containing protein n=1 Tax=Allochromatium vinosum (strain ATCC 17899 / DSM 180 / NBRC 103801 / NCIMB 10441 / D) TaxID=572477 RepID=D3RRK7_ALLVD|nr:PilX N-terminal domain-containing pilus assembly protein [Allochromatium vinosum]ADC63919.1 hypothetical protein Alvin_3019 [Allochromatium vinosum DSM 180]
MMFYAKRQRGAALVIAAVLLVAMTLISVTSMRSSVTNIKISTNQRMKQGAYQAAESALMQILDENPHEVIPKTNTVGDFEKHPNYYQDRLKSDDQDRPYTEADVIMRFEGRRNNILISGEALGSIVLLYQADAYGRVRGVGGESVGAGAVNRMGAGLVRPSQ